MQSVFLEEWSKQPLVFLLQAEKQETSGRGGGGRDNRKNTYKLMKLTNYFNIKKHQPAPTDTGWTGERAQLWSQRTQVQITAFF